MKKLPKALRITALIAAACFGLLGRLEAQMTWTGLGGDNNFSTAANWTGGTPTNSSNSSLTFAGTTRLTGDANSGGWNVSGITFNSTAGAFTLTDGGLTIGSGGITNNSTSTQTINNQITVNATETWNAANGNIVYNGYIGGNGQNLTLATGTGKTMTVNGQLNGAGTLTTSGSGATVFNGTVSATTVNLGGTSTASATFSSGSTLGGSINVTSSGAVNVAGAINNATLSLNGTGTTTLSGSASKNITSTVVNSGTLFMNQAGGSATNGTLTVNNGGTVVMGANNQVPAWSSITLNNGSTLNLNNTTQTISNLTITGNTTIDFGGSGSALNVTYNGLNIANGVTVTLVNWNSSVDTFAAQNNPGSNVTVQYADSNGNVYATGTWNGGSITPTTPVPEPRTYGLILMLVGLAVAVTRSWSLRIQAGRVVRATGKLVVSER